MPFSTGGREMKDAVYRCTANEVPPYTSKFWEFPCKLLSTDETFTTRKSNSFWCQKHYKVHPYFAPYLAANLKTLTAHPGFPIVFPPHPPMLASKVETQPALAGRTRSVTASQRCSCQWDAKNMIQKRQQWDHRKLLLAEVFLPKPLTLSR